MAIMTADNRWPGVQGLQIQGLGIQKPGVHGLGLHALAVAAFLVVLTPDFPLNAQGLDSPNTIDAIVGSDVQEEESQATADAGKIIAAIEKTPDSIAAVRKTSNLDKVDIVFLADATVAEGGPPAAIEKKVKEHEAEIAELRKEIEGNAMLYHAIDSRRVLTRDVLAVDFKDDRNVIIYAAAKPAK